MLELLNGPVEGFINDGFESTVPKPLVAFRSDLVDNGNNRSDGFVREVLVPDSPLKAFTGEGLELIDTLFIHKTVRLGMEIQLAVTSRRPKVDCITALFVNEPLDIAGCVHELYHCGDVIWIVLVQIDETVAGLLIAW